MEILRRISNFHMAKDDGSALQCAVQGTSCGKLASVLLVNEALRCGNANLWFNIYIYIVDHSGVSGIWMDQVSYFRIIFHHTTLLFRVIIQWVRANPIWTPLCCSHCCPHQNPHNLTSGIVKNKANVNGKFPWLSGWSANCYGGYASSGALGSPKNLRLPPNPAKTNEAFVSREFPNLWTYKIKMISQNIQTMYIINTY
jgi:hypothetical protein